MSTEIIINCEYFREILNHLKYFIPRGDTALNVCISIINKKLYFACKSFAMYRAYLGYVDAEDTEVTIRYHDILPYIRNSETYTLDINETFVTLATDIFSVKFATSYDFIEVDLPEPNGMELQEINQEVFVSLKQFMLSSVIFNVMKKEFPYIIYDGIIVLKTPSMWFQGRCPGLKMNAVLAYDVLKTVVQLQPTEYCIHDRSLILFSDYYACTLPIEVIVEENNFKSVMDGLNEAVTFNSGTFRDTTASMLTLKPQYAQLTLGSSGFKITAHAAECDISSNVGKLDEVIFNCRAPIELLNIIFKMIGTNVTTQVLYRRDTICFRTQTLVTILRVTP